MWDELRERVALERRQIHRLVRVHRALLDKFAASPPDEIELSALAARFHSFYNGLENIFKRVTLELGDPMPGSESWHKELLDSMSEAMCCSRFALTIISWAIGTLPTRPMW